MFCIIYNNVMRKIVITSGKGGVGKTTVTATLGRRLAKDGFRVCLVDGDVGLNNLDVATGIEARVVYDVGDVLRGKCRPFQALVRDNETDMRILPSTNLCEDISAQAFRGVVDGLDGAFDFVLIDCPAGIEHGFHRAVSSADEAIVVTTPYASAIRDADKVLRLLDTYHLKDVSLVVNRVRLDLVRKGEALTAQEIANLLYAKLVGVIPDDDVIAITQQLGKSSDFAPSAKAFSLLAKNVEEGSAELMLVQKRWWRRR